MSLINRRVQSLPILVGMKMTNSVLRSKAALALSLLALSALVGCAIEVQNLKPARDYAAQNRPEGSVQVGWRVFEQRCASCHGHSASAGVHGPDLLPRMQTMGPRRFADWVLRKYDWNIPAASRTGDGAELDALVDRILQRKDGDLTMPAWRDDPEVREHILGLYVYLAARADGTQGPGQPKP